MIIWYCDICGKKITDDGPLCGFGGPVWKLSGVAEPIYSLEGEKKRDSHLKLIVCPECKKDLIYRIDKTVTQAIKDRIWEINKEEDDK